MASENDKNNELKNPGLKKRNKSEASPNQESAPEAKVDDGVVRAPKAPTTAPNAPSQPTKGRRVVDPKEEAEKAARAKKARAEAARKQELDKAQKTRKKTQKNARQDRPSPKAQPESPQSNKSNAPPKAAQNQGSGGASGFQFGDSGATMDDFAAMFNAQERALPKRERYQVGDTVEGTVVSIGSRYIFVDLGGPTEGIADRAQYLDEEGELTLSAGEQHEFYIIGFQGGIQLGREIGAGRSGLDAIETAHASGLPISGRVTGTNKGGFEVNINGVEAFCPISQIELGFTEDPEIHVGNTYTFEVSEVREGGRTIVVSRTALLERERAEQREKTLKSLTIGEEIDGVITRVADFGVFVDIGGIEGLVHVSEMSHVFFDKPSDIAQAGDQVTVQIMSIEEDPKRPGELRIGLSIKEAQDDPWLKVNDQFSVGQTVPGTIVRVTTFGAFVEIAPGVEGLVHVSEMSWKKHIANPQDFVQVGQQVQVQVQDIDLMRRRISLSMKAAEGDPWSEITDRFALGMEVEGAVLNTEDFGAFIDLGEGITALLPRSEMDLPKDVSPHRKYSPGAKVSARVLSIEPARRRMALTLKDASEIDAGSAQPSASSPSPSGPRSYQDEDVSHNGTFGTLGDLLKAKKND